MTTIKAFLQKSNGGVNTQNPPNIQALENLLMETDAETNDPDLRALEELFFMKVPVKSSQNDSCLQLKHTNKTKNSETAITNIFNRTNNMTCERLSRSPKSDYSTFAQDSKLLKLLTGPDSSIADELNARKPNLSVIKKRQERYSLQKSTEQSSSLTFQGRSTPKSNNTPSNKRNSVISQLLAQPSLSPSIGYLPAMSSPITHSSSNSDRDRLSGGKRPASVLRNLIMSPVAFPDRRASSCSPNPVFSRKAGEVMSPNLIKDIKKEPDDNLQPVSHQIAACQDPPELRSKSNSSANLMSSYFTESASGSKISDTQQDLSTGVKSGCEANHTVLHQCDICDTVFTAWSSLVEHKKVHGIEKTQRCEACDARFFTVNELLDHLKTHTEDVKPVICDGCQACFHDENALKGHNCNSAASRQFHCLKCKEDFSSEDLLNEHVKTHNENKTFGCSECKSRFASMKAVKIHMKAHNRKRMHRCNRCSKSFTHKHELQLHKKKHKGKGPKFCCQICNKSFKFEAKFKKHVAEHMGEKIFQCEECDMGFNAHSALVRHMKAHSGENLHSCPECGKCFSYSGNLTTHLKTHFEEKPHVCEQCGERFAKRTHLAAHRDTHAEKVLYKCQQCGRICNTYRHLMRHVRCHSIERPFKCDQCVKSFIDKEKLAMHVMTHTGEKPYKCPLCEKRFVHKSSISQHIKVHATERSFNCGMCGGHFTSEQELMMHIKSHTDQAVAAVMNGVSHIPTSVANTNELSIPTHQPEKTPSFSDHGDLKMKIKIVRPKTQNPQINLDTTATKHSTEDCSSSATLYSIVTNISNTIDKPDSPGAVRVKQEPVDDYESQGQSSQTGNESEVRKWTVHDSQFISPV